MSAKPADVTMADLNREFGPRPAIREGNLTDDASAKPLDLTPLAQRWQGAPPEREWLIKDWIPANTVVSLYGDGGTGKTLLGMQIGTCVGALIRFLGLETAGGKVVGIFCEDDDAELWRRQADINAGYNIGMEDLEDRVIWISRAGQDNLLCTFDGQDAIKLTHFWYEVRATLAAYRPTLLEIDTAADTFGGNDISTPQVRQFIQVALGSLAREFNCTILLLAHPSVAGMANGEGSHGSRAWNNAVRSRLYLEHEKQEGVDIPPRILSRKKANYAARDDQIRLEWDRGMFWPINERGTHVRAREHQAQTAFVELLRWHQNKGLRTSLAPNSPNYYAKQFTAAQKKVRSSYRFSRKDYEAAALALLDDGRVQNRYDSKLRREYLEVVELYG